MDYKKEKIVQVKVYYRCTKVSISNAFAYFSILKLAYIMLK